MKGENRDCEEGKTTRRAQWRKKGEGGGYSLLGQLTSVTQYSRYFIYYFFSY
jgi:hypothetical protein